MERHRMTPTVEPRTGDRDAGAPCPAPIGPWHIAALLAVKFALLVALWAVFVRGHQVPVDAANAAAHIATHPEGTAK
jgi:hypothetical protein